VYERNNYIEIDQFKDIEIEEPYKKMLLTVIFPMKRLRIVMMKKVRMNQEGIFISKYSSQVFST